MTTSRMLAVPAIAAASLLALTGCFQLPPMGGTGSTGGTGGTTETTAPETEGGTTDGGAVDLTGTTWTGTDAAGNEMDMVLEEDGTVLLNDWNGSPFDSAGDTWEVSGDQITIFIDEIQDIQSLEYTGTATEGEMQLTGTDGNGDSGYDVTLTQG